MTFPELAKQAYQAGIAENEEARREDERKQRVKDCPGRKPEHEGSDPGANDRSSSHRYQKASVAPENGKALIATVTCEANEHRWKADDQRKTTGQLDVEPEQEHERWNEKLAAGYPHERGDDPDTEARQGT